MVFRLFGRTLSNKSGLTRYLVIILLLNSWGMHVLGQEGTPSMFFDHLTISDGLSHNTVHCMLQDRHGYMWIGTQHGLNKYDGYTCKVIQPAGEAENRANDISGEKITALYEDHLGNLWVGTGKQGVHVKAADSDYFVKFRDSIAAQNLTGYEITSVYEDKSFQIWFTTIGNGLFRYDRANELFQHFNQANSGLSSDVVFDIVQDQYGTIWVATAGGGLNVLGLDEQFQLSHEMLPGSPNLSGYRKKLVLDGNYMWIGTEGTGLYRMYLNDRSYTHFELGSGSRGLSSNGVRDIVKASDDKLFIATDGGGLNVYDLLTDSVSIYSHEAETRTGLNSNALYCFWKDRTGNIWIGTYNGGINIHKPDKVWFDRFAPGLPHCDALENRSILSLAQTGDGQVWVGTDGGGLNRINPESIRFDTPPLRKKSDQKTTVSGNIVKSLFEDSNEALWIGFFGEGLDYFKPATGKIKNMLGPPYNVWSITERTNGEIWVGTMGEGIVVIDKDRKSKKYRRHEPGQAGSLADLNVMVVYADNNNHVWVGTADQGLDRWNEASGTFEHYNSDPSDPFSISSNAIRSIFQDSRGDLWVGTEGGGLNRWLGEGCFEHIGLADGLIAKSVMGISEDREGMLWITTFEGVSRFNPISRTFRNFDFRTFQHSNQFNQSAVLTTTNGKLLFGGINGLNTLDPGKIKPQNFDTEVIFTELNVLNQTILAGKLPDGREILSKPIEYADRIQLSYQDKSFSFSFAAVDFTNPSDYRYEYKMEGFDDDWRMTEAGQNKASYTNLDPGKYTFMVRFQDQVASIQVFIEAPFWQTTWFRFGIFFIILSASAAGIIMIIKRREAVYRGALLQLQNEKLAAELDARSSKLMYSAVQIAHKNEILTGLKADLLAIQKEFGVGLGSTVRKVNQELQNEDHWKEFDIYFNQVNQGFFKSLLEKHPELTSNDLRMCALIRMNLSTKEIAFLLNISIRAVEQGRYRLKKRLKLGKEEDLNKYISGLSLEGLS